MRLVDLLLAEVGERAELVQLGLVDEAGAGSTLLDEVGVTTVGVSKPTSPASRTVALLVDRCAIQPRWIELSRGSNSLPSPAVPSTVAAIARVPIFVAVIVNGTARVPEDVSTAGR